MHKGAWKKLPLLSERNAAHGRRRSNPTSYLLTSFLRCLRCGHGFVGTIANGRGGAYRYYTCFSRHRHGTKACDQERIPADPLEDAIVTVTLDALDDGSLFVEAARRAHEAWIASNPALETELQQVNETMAEQRRAPTRYLRAFEAGDLSSKSCGERVRELEASLQVLEARRATLEAERDLAPEAVSDPALKDLRAKIAKAVADAAPEQVKELLAAVISEIAVESRASIQPFFIAPGVRIVLPQRRWTGIEPAGRVSSSHRFCRLGGTPKSVGASDQTLYVVKRPATCSLRRQQTAERPRSTDVA
jgi:hypothetical protein